MTFGPTLFPVVATEWQMPATETKKSLGSEGDKKEIVWKETTFSSTDWQHVH